MSVWRERADQNGLLRTVHERLGGLGVDIRTFGNGSVEVRWRRDYDGEWSDERWISGSSISEVLGAILDYEDAADAEDEDEPVTAPPSSGDTT